MDLSSVVVTYVNGQPLTYAECREMADVIRPYEPNEADFLDREAAAVQRAFAEGLSPDEIFALKDLPSLCPHKIRAQVEIHNRSYRKKLKADLWKIGGAMAAFMFLALAVCVTAIAVSKLLRKVGT